MGLNKAGICKVDGCEKPVKRSGGAKGMCAMRYRRMQKHGSPHVVLVNSRHYGKEATCKEADCDNPPYGHDLCKKHYYRFYRNQNPEAAVEAARKAWNAKKAAREQAMGRPQSGLCEICGTDEKVICFDHDHNTGAPRGWICGGCNAGLGHFKDSAERLRAAADYLDRFASAVRAGDAADARERQLDAQVTGLQGVLRAERDTLTQTSGKPDSAKAATAAH